jgi:aminoglycoside phosphotransferase (APT) family kinase protein
VSVPAIVAIDDGDEAMGRPCFVMEFVDGRGLVDSPEGSYHGDPWLSGAGPEVQRSLWNGFHDALATLHRIDPATVPDASLGPNGLADVIAYWRESLLDATPFASVPRHLALLDQMWAHLPPGADDDPAVCMGDARMVNCIVEGNQVRALVDFEVAYVGNPAADIAYSLFMDAQRPPDVAALPGIPTPDETWARWSAATGRRADDQDYWTAFGAMIVGITATRAMVQWGLAGPDLEASNPFVAAWETSLAEAAR